MPKRWSVGILGAGRIAQGFDSPSSPHVLTMAHAIQKSTRFKLGGFYDKDPQRAAAAEKKWKCPPSPRHRDAWLAQGWDVIYIATPDQQHAQDLRDALRRNPLGILAEKPLTVSNRESEILLRQARRESIPLLVNFPRRWHSALRALRQQIQKNQFGAPMLVQFVYSGGSVHNGVHMMDLFRTLWGGTWKTTSVQRDGQRWLLKLRAASDVALTITNLPPNPYFVFDMTVYCSRGKVQLGGSPETLTISRLVPDPLFAGFKVVRDLKRVNLEKEPLILRSLERLGELMENPREARHHVDLEIENQRFLSQILDRLGHR